MYIQMFFRPIRMLADRYNTLQMGIVASSRIINLLDDKEFIAESGTHNRQSFVARWFSIRFASLTTIPIMF